MYQSVYDVETIAGVEDAVFKLSARNRDLDVLIRKMEQCWADKRTYGQMIWQTPALSTVIIAVLFAGLLSATENSRNYAVTLVVALFSLGIAVVGTVHLVKQRFFDIAFTMYVEALQERIDALVNQPMRFPVRFQTEQIIEDQNIRPPNGMLDRQSAYRWLFGFMVTLTGFLSFVVALTTLLMIGVLRIG